MEGVLPGISPQSLSPRLYMYNEFMKLTMVMAMSVNGLITRGDEGDVTKWTSAEDQKHFRGMLAQHGVVIMGRTTYGASKAGFKAGDKRLRLVLTRQPDAYAHEAIQGRIEFSDKLPTQVLAELSERGFSEGLLLGGGGINQLFLAHNLVDEIVLTVEPKLFGRGTQLVAEGKLWERDLELVSVEKMNKRGTLLLRYKVGRG